MASCPIACGVGVLVAWLLVPHLYRLVLAVYAMHIAPLLGYSFDLKKHGKWAIVTGSSDGIGRAYAFELAAKGLDVLLVSRTEAKLQQVAKEIEAQFPGRKTRTVVVDFEKTDKRGYHDLENELREVANDVSILVNNAGTEGRELRYFHLTTKKTPQDHAYDIVQTNVQHVPRLTAFILPYMIAKKGGMIVNISSSSILLPTPYLNVYGATKSFIDYFSSGLPWELRNTGVEVQTVIPFGVMTNIMDDATRMTSLMQLNVSPEHFAKSSVLTLGILKRTYGCMFHTLQGIAMELLVQLIPVTAVQWFIDVVLMQEIKRTRESKMA